MILKYITIVTLIVVITLSCGKKKSPFLFFPSSSEGDQTTLNNNSDSNNSTSGSNNDSNSGSNNNSSSGTNNNLNSQINDQYGNLSYNFQTILDVNVNISVLDPDGPVSGAIISITDPTNNHNLYQSITNSNGVVTGVVQISTSLQYVNLSVQVGNISLQFQVPVTQLNQYLITIDRIISFEQDVNNNNPVDSDNDGTPDDNDIYPHDPSRATKIIFPNGGLGIIAFEDLFPVPGDADFNDVVLKITIEEDLNTQGQIVRIRGNYQFLARGAGYNHVVLIKLQGGGTLIQKVYDGNNSLVNQINTHVDSLTKLPLFLKDSLYFANPSYDSSSLYTTHELCGWNSRTDNVYIPCYSSQLEVIFDQPQSKEQLKAPYDLYIYVKNTRKEIHFPNLYFNADGTDKYLDSNGFPWAILIPSKWNWPYERQYMTYGYPCFDEWYISRGVHYTDWYIRTDSNSRAKIFPYFIDIQYQDIEGCR